MADNDIRITIRLKDLASQGLDGVSTGIREIGNSAKIAAGLLAGITAATAAMTAGAMKSVADTSAEFEKFETILKTLTGSSENAKKSMTWIREFAQKTPYEVAQVTDAFVKLSSYGLDAQAMLGTLGDTAAAMGKPLTQTVEMMADAVTGEFERLKEFGIRAKQSGDSVTFSWVENGKQMSQSVQKTGADIQKFLIDTLQNRFGGAMGNLSATWSGMISNLSDSWTNFKASIGDAGLFDVLKEELSGIINKINELQEDGTLAIWAQQASENLTQVLEIFKSLGTIFTDAVAVISDDSTILLDILSYISNEIKTLPSEVQKAFGQIELAMNSLVGTWLEIKESFATVTLDFDKIPGIDKLIEQQLKQRQIIENTIKTIEKEKAAITDSSAAALDASRKKIEALVQERAAKTENANLSKIQAKEEISQQKQAVAEKKISLKTMLADTKSILALEKAEYRQKIQQIQQLEDKGVISHKQAQERKKQAELDFLRLKVEKTREAVQQAIAEFGRESNEYRTAKAQMIQAENDLAAAVARTTATIKTQAAQTSVAVAEVKKLSAASASASTGTGESSSSSLSGKKIGTVIRRETAWEKSMAWLSRDRTLAQKQIKHAALDIMGLDKEYAAMRKTVQALGGDLTGLWDTPLNDIRRYIAELRSAQAHMQPKKEPKINVLFTGTGSTERPLSEKIAEMTGKLANFSAIASQGIAKNIDFRGISGAYAKATATGGKTMGQLQDFGVTKLEYGGKRFSLIGQPDTIRELQRTIRSQNKVLP